MKNSQTLHVLVLTWLQIPDYFSLHSLDRNAAKFLHTLAISNEFAFKPASEVSARASLLVLGTGHGRARTCKFWWPRVSTRLPEKESKLLWLVIEIESSLLVFSHASHFRIVFLILFSYLRKRQHLGDGHIKKKAPKCSEIRYTFKKPFFFSWMWKYVAGLKFLGKKASFLICLTFWYEAVKIIMLTKEWLCRCCICSSKSGPCQEELE